MILTVTINPAIDRNVTVDRLVFEDRAYILSTSETPGGRGINATRLIHSFGGSTMALVTSGGDSGERLRHFLAAAGYHYEFVPIANEIRVNLTISDRHGLTIKLNELGPALSREELDRIERAVSSHFDRIRWLMICGSVPPGTPSDFYARLIHEAKSRGVETLLDADGEVLREAIEAAPTLVTPNQQEAERLLDTALITRNQFLDAAARIRSMGAQNVILSLGSRGAIGAFTHETIEAIPPRIEAVCPIGAGDALAAAYVWARRRGHSEAESLRWGVAAGTASARLPGLTFATLDQTREVLPLVNVRQVS